jgi:hypothetical protein
MVAESAYMELVMPLRSERMRTSASSRLCISLAAIMMLMEVPAVERKDPGCLVVVWPVSR